MLILLLLASYAQAQSPCLPGCDCSMLFDGSDCTLPSATFTVDYSYSYVNVRCAEPNDTIKCSELPQYVTDSHTVPSFSIDGCTLLDESIACVMNAFGVTATNSLFLKSVRDPDGTALMLKPAHLDSLDSLQMIVIMNNDNLPTKPTEFPYAAARLPNLRRINIHKYDVRLLAGGFASGSNLSNLELAMDGIDSLPAGWLAGVRLRSLGLWSNRLTSFTREQLEGQDSLQVLSLQSNSITHLAPDVFAATPNLNKLYLMNNSLAEITRDTFAPLKNLTMLRIWDNRANLTIHSRAFSLPTLQELIIFNNNISSLPRDVFHNAMSLKTINLSKNKLELLPNDVFKDLLSLELLDLSRNRIEVLSKYIFSRLKSLKSLVLDDNRIRVLDNYVFDGLLSITSISINRNLIETVATRAFGEYSTLRVLKLSNNKIKDNTYNGVESVQSPFNRLRSLTDLDLSRNQLTQIYDDWRFDLLELKTLDLKYNNFTRLTTVETLLVSDTTVDLRYNHIATIHQGRELSLPSQHAGTYLVQHNPLRCDCQIYELVKNKPDRIKLDDVTCASPKHLEGRVIRNLPPRELTCPLPQEICPPQCECINIPDTKTIELTCPFLSSYNIPAQPNYEVILKLNKTTDSLKNIPKEISLVTLSYLNLTDVPVLSHTINSLDLRNNRISQISIESLREFNATLYLSNNPLGCDCWNYDQIIAMRKYKHKILDYKNVTCSDKEYLWLVNAKQLCQPQIVTIIGTSLAILGVLIAITSVLLYRHSLKVRVWLYARVPIPFLFPKEVDDKKTYDAFVSFSQLDEKFVIENLLPGLENEPYCFKVCVHYRDWIAGDWIPAQIVRSVEESRRTIIVLSKNFVKSIWSTMEFRAAHQSALNEGRSRVIIVLLEEISLDNIDEELKAYLESNTYVKWGDKWFWDKLRYALPHRKGEKMLNREGDKLKKSGIDTQLSPDGKIVNAALTAPSV